MWNYAHIFCNPYLGLNWTREGGRSGDLEISPPNYFLINFQSFLKFNVPIDTPVLCPNFAFTHQSTFTLLSPGFSLAECNCCNLLLYLDIPFGLHTPRDWLLAVSCGTSIPPGKRYLKARSDPGYYPTITTHKNTTHTWDNYFYLH